MKNLRLEDKDYIESYITKENVTINCKEYSNEEIAACIDHTILKPDATPEDVITICEEALEYNFASVCVNSCYTPVVAKILEDSTVKTCVVVGFPLGAMSSAGKVAETKDAITHGANEIDMVINVGMLKGCEYEYVFNDIKAVSDTAHEMDAICKVIIETSLLSESEKVIACLISKAAKVDFVKTSTGFNGGGATVEDIQLMKRVVVNELKIKASGGIRSREDALDMLNSGADRIGASAGIKIVTNQISDENY